MKIKDFFWIIYLRSADRSRLVRLQALATTLATGIQLHDRELLSAHNLSEFLISLGLTSEHFIYK